jgi:Icc protein
VGLRNGAALRTALAEQPSVRALLAGHVHQANEQRLGDILVLTTPSTCLQFRPGVERFEADDRGPACRRLELLPDGALRTQVLWAD